MSPIFVRPVREQLEHDRLIRHLQARFKRKYEVGANIGDEQVAPVKIGTHTFFPDLVLTSDNKLAGLVEIETGESVNNLEAMAQWVHFARARAPFSLYVPVQVFDTARRLCEALGVRATEIWTYRGSLDNFDLVRMVHDATTARAQSSAPRTRPAGARAASKPKPAVGKSSKAAPKPKKTAKKTAKKAPARTKKAPTRKAPARAKATGRTAKSGARKK